jgi:hypothetical protein
LNVQRILTTLAGGCGALLLSACASQGPASAPGPSDPLELGRFIRWFGGEFDNHEQVWQQRIDAAKPGAAVDSEKTAHSHSVFAPISLPALGQHIYYVQQSLDGDLSKVYRQRLYRITADEAAKALRLEIFNIPNAKAVLNAHLKPELLADLDPNTLRHAKGCDVLWRYDGASESFEGQVVPNACSYLSPQLGKRIIVNDTLKLTANQIWINDQARDEQGNHVFGSKSNTPVKARKVRYFTGWAFGADPDGRKLRGERALLMHNEGHTLGLFYEDGSASPYQVQLAQLTYQNTTAPILKLALLDTRTPGKSVAYTWANTDASRIGLNLGWVQFGLTLKGQDVSLGTPGK